MICFGWVEKIAGAAQRRNKFGLLIQGSVQPPPISLSRPDWQQAMREVAREQWSVDWLNLTLETAPALHDCAQALRDDKFGCDSFNRRR